MSTAISKHGVSGVIKLEPIEDEDEIIVLPPLRQFTPQGTPPPQAFLPVHPIQQLPTSRPIQPAPYPLRRPKVNDPRLEVSQESAHGSPSPAKDEHEKTKGSTTRPAREKSPEPSQRTQSPSGGAWRRSPPHMKPPTEDFRENDASRSRAKEVDEEFLSNRVVPRDRSLASNRSLPRPYPPSLSHPSPAIPSAPRQPVIPTGPRGHLVIQVPPRLPPHPTRPPSQPRSAPSTSLSYRPRPSSPLRTYPTFRRESRSPPPRRYEPRSRSPPRSYGTFRRESRSPPPRRGNDPFPRGRPVSRSPSSPPRSYTASRRESRSPSRRGNEPLPRGRLRSRSRSPVYSRYEYEDGRTRRGDRVRSQVLNGAYGSRDRWREERERSVDRAWRYGTRDRVVSEGSRSYAAVSPGRMGRERELRDRSPRGYLARGWERERSPGWDRYGYVARERARRRGSRSRSRSSTPEVKRARVEGRYVPPPRVDLNGGRKEEVGKKDGAGKEVPRLGGDVVKPGGPVQAKVGSERIPIERPAPRPADTLSRAPPVSSKDTQQLSQPPPPAPRSQAPPTIPQGGLINRSRLNPLPATFSAPPFLALPTSPRRTPLTPKSITASALNATRAFATPDTKPDLDEVEILLGEAEASDTEVEVVTAPFTGQTPSAPTPTTNKNQRKKKTGPTQQLNPLPISIHPVPTPVLTPSPSEPLSPAPPFGSRSSTPIGRPPLRKSSFPPRPTTRSTTPIRAAQLLPVPVDSPPPPTSNPLLARLGMVSQPIPNTSNPTARGPKPKGNQARKEKHLGLGSTTPPPPKPSSLLARLWGGRQS